MFEAGVLFRAMKIDGIIIRDPRHFEGVFRRSEILITETEVQCQIAGCFPRILEEIRLAKEVGIVNGAPKHAAKRTAGSPEVVQEICECAGSGPCVIQERTALVEPRMLARQMPKAI